jgi:uncharacterized phosphosugar-binding protein
MLDRYTEAARQALGQVAATQNEALEEAARLVADSVAAGGILHLFGAGHSQLLALDAYARAGGLACVNPILDPALSPATGLELARVERTEGRAAEILAGEDLRPGEVVLIASNSGVNAVPVEVAIGCRERGLRVAELLGERGHRPPVLASQNLDGRPAVQDNAELIRPYLDRVRANRDGQTGPGRDPAPAPAGELR